MLSKVKGKNKPSSVNGEVAPNSLMKLYLAVLRLEETAYEQEKYEQEILNEVSKRCEHTSIRRFAEQAGVDTANLARVFSGQRRLSRTMLTKLQAALNR